MVDTSTSLQAPAPVSTGLKRYWQQLRNVFDSLFNAMPDRAATNVRLLILLLVSALLVAVLINLALWWHDRDFRPLYGQGEHYNLGAIMEILDKQGIGYRINPDDGQLLVHSDQIASARMAMAAGGIVSTGARSWLPENSGMGSSHYEERMQYLAALEASLSDTISGIEAVRYARVHLAVPEQSVFFRSSPPAKASVYLELYSGMRLQPDQIEGIMRLVSGSVASLDEQEVTVVDQYGNLLSQPIVLAMLAGDGDNAQPYLTNRVRIESHLEQQLANILDAAVGAGRYRVDVAAELTRDKLEQSSEQFDPNIVLRSESVEGGVPYLMDKPAPITQGPPVPPVGPNLPQKKSSEDVGEQKVIRNYEVSRQISSETHYPGAIKRLTIAVLIDSTSLKDLAKSAATASDDTTDPDATTAASLKQSEERLTELVKQGVGFDAARGDAISLALLPFAPVPAPSTAAMDQKSINQWLDIVVKVIQVILLLVTCALILLGCRKLLRPGAAVQVGEQPIGIATADEQPVLQSGEKLSPISLEEQMARYRDLAQSEPEKVAAVLKDWINRNRANG